MFFRAHDVRRFQIPGKSESDVKSALMAMVSNKVSNKPADPAADDEGDDLFG